MSFADLPVEILHIIARNGYDVVRAMLAVPAFARTLTRSIVWDYRIAFGETVGIYGYGIVAISWGLNGKRHRVDGHALEYIDGTRAWFIEGKRHCVNGPAVTRADGSCEWYFNDELHRVGGPAVIYADGSCEYWLNGVRQPDQ